jgi:hypothetical protein
MDAVDMRRARMTADIAKPLFHHTLSFSRFVPEIVREARGDRTKLCNRWSSVSPVQRGRVHAENAEERRTSLLFSPFLRVSA